MYNFLQLKEASKIFTRAISIKIKGYKKYEGNASKICKQIIHDCWNNTYFQTSNGHFSSFYIRDFSYCVNSLLKLGYRKKVIQTLNFALEVFSKNNKITTTINEKGKPVHIFTYGSDSLPLFLNSLIKAKAFNLIKKHKKFFNEQINYYYEYAFDKNLGLIKKDIFLSSIKDSAIRVSPLYDNCMVALLSNDLKKIKFLKNPFKPYNLKKTIKDNFWNGSYFLEDLSHSSLIAGDANTFPFWTNVFTSKKMIKSSINAIQKEKLDKPFPLKYTNLNIKENRLKLINFLIPNYEGNPIWLHLGLCYLDVVEKVNKKLLKEYLSKYKNLVEKNKNFLELFNPDGSIFKNLVYHADDSLLWSSILLEKLKRFKNIN